MDQIDYKQLLLNLIGSLTCDDHMGDVADSVFKALELAGIDVPEEADNILEAPFSNFMHSIGATTLWGTSLECEED